MAKVRVPTQITGMKGAMEIYGALFDEGFDVYVPLMYIRHDCIIKKGTSPHLDIEIKTRTEGKDRFVISNIQPRSDLFVICHVGGSQESWVIPSAGLEDSRIAYYQSKADRYVIDINPRKKKILQPYFRAFHLLESTSYGTKGPKIVKGKKAEPVKGAHLTQPFYEEEALRILQIQSEPLATKEIIDKLQKNLAGRFSNADLEFVSRGRPRWNVTARFAIYQGLKKKKLIESKGKNQWVITEAGRELMKGKRRF